jgi:hypothetical protein
VLSVIALEGIRNLPEPRSHTADCRIPVEFGWITVGGLPLVGFDHDALGGTGWTGEMQPLIGLTATVFDSSAILGRSPHAPRASNLGWSGEQRSGAGSLPYDPIDRSVDLLSFDHPDEKHGRASVRR